MSGFTNNLPFEISALCIGTIKLAELSYIEKLDLSIVVAVISSENVVRIPSVAAAQLVKFGSFVINELIIP